MINQNTIDTLTENLATELSLDSYDHPRLAEIAQNQLYHLILEVTRYPSKYFSSEILETAKRTAKNHEETTHFTRTKGSTLITISHSYSVTPKPLKCDRFDYCNHNHSVLFN
ncbi:MAG: hypothetical protein QNJ37_08360 [Crocosphaera sp.]|nr:hypothetical protein [Crocosphaera sp.]